MQGVPMTAKNPKNKCKSFIELEALIARNPVACKPICTNTTKTANRAPQKKELVDDGYEERLFERAMADVKPIRSNKHLPIAPPVAALPTCTHDDEQEVIDRLKDLVSSGKGFEVSLTPEYIEGIRPGESRHILKRLHQGHFAVQDHIDLHGFTITEAHQAFGDFLQRSIARGLRTLLVVHGRGLSSPAEPVIKTHVKKWLMSGTWAKWVLAFASARACDGGAGATYVLLRHRPYSKQTRR
jgi:DNA-nicking Smr family endonuclease